MTNTTSEKLQIIVPSDVLKSSILKTTIDTECLFGEIFKIFCSKGNYYFGKSIDDKYQGWIKSNSLGSVTNYNHIVSSIRTSVLEKPDVKSKLIFFLHIRSKVKVIKSLNSWVKIAIPSKNKSKYGYIFKSHTIKKKSFQSDWVNYAELFLGTPYRWGGRNSFGVDCSALLQLSIAFSGELIPRDTKDQITYFLDSKKFKVFELTSFINCKRGNIIFWEGHVAIVIDSLRLIHSSATHNQVLIEEISTTLFRIKKAAKLVTKVD